MLSFFPTVIMLLVNTRGISSQQNSQQVDWIQVYKKVSRSVVSVTAGDVAGAGFFVLDSKHVATCYHVIDGSENIEIKTYSDQKIKAKVISALPDKDIAILELNTQAKEPNLLLADKVLPDVGQPVALVGDPLGLEQSISTGIVSQIRRDGDVIFIQTDASASHGNSGGPLVNANGQVLGMLQFLVKNGNNLNFAIFAKHVREALNSIGISSIGSRAKNDDEIKSKSIEADAARQSFTWSLPKGFEVSKKRVGHSWMFTASRGGASCFVEVNDELIDGDLMEYPIDTSERLKKADSTYKSLLLRKGMFDGSPAVI